MKRPERPGARPPAAPPATARPTRPPITARPAPPAAEVSATPAPRRAPRNPRPAPVEPSPASARRAGRIRRRQEKAELRRFTRASRRRRIGWLTVFGILGLVGGLIAVAVFSPILALREVRVEGTSRLDPAVLAEAVSGQMGTPLALLDDGRIRDELGAFPVIRSYSTEPDPTGTLVITVVERSPLGVVATASGFLVVDAAGVTLESSPGRPAGLPLFELDADGVQGPAFAAMSEVLLALPPEVLAQVDAITARTRDDVTLRFAGSDQRVVWGSAQDSPRKALILAALLGQFAGSGPGEYDVSAPGSAVFRPE